MAEETIHEENAPQKAWSDYVILRWFTNRLGRGEPIRINDDQRLTVEMPPDPDMEVELESKNNTVSLDVELK